MLTRSRSKRRKLNNGQAVSTFSITDSTTMSTETLLMFWTTYCSKGTPSLNAQDERLRVHTDFLNLFLDTPVSDRNELCRAAGKVEARMSNTRNAANLLQLSNGDAGPWFEQLASFHISRLPQINALKAMVLRKLMDGDEGKRPYILIVNVPNLHGQHGTHPYHYREHPHDRRQLLYGEGRVCLYEGLVGDTGTTDLPDLGEFTADLFLSTLHDFNFIRFDVGAEHPENRPLLTRLKVLAQWHTDRSLFLLVLLMTKYFQLVLVQTIQEATMHFSMNADVRGVLMAYLGKTHPTLNVLFQDKELVQALMLEVSRASLGWQDILVSILEGDADFRKAYTPCVDLCYACEKLNLFNVRHTQQQGFGLNWLESAFEHCHFEVFTVLMSSADIVDDTFGAVKVMFDKLAYVDLLEKGQAWVDQMEKKISRVAATVPDKTRKKIMRLQKRWQTTG